MDVLLKLPMWMVERIVWILERAGEEEIAEKIKRQVTEYDQ